MGSTCPAIISTNTFGPMAAPVSQEPMISQFFFHRMKAAAQEGAQVVVYERDQSRDARVQDSALDLHEDSGLAVLEAAGLTDAF